MVVGKSQQLAAFVLGGEVGALYRDQFRSVGFDYPYFQPECLRLFVHAITGNNHIVFVDQYRPSGPALGEALINEGLVFIAVNPVVSAVCFDIHVFALCLK